MRNRDNGKLQAECRRRVCVCSLQQNLHLGSDGTSRKSAQSHPTSVFTFIIITVFLSCLLAPVFPHGGLHAGNHAGLPVGCRLGDPPRPHLPWSVGVGVSCSLCLWTIVACVLAVKVGESVVRPRPSGFLPTKTVYF